MFTVSENGRRRWFCAAVLMMGMLLLFGVLSLPTAAQVGPPTLTIAKETDPDGGEDFPFTVASNGATIIWGVYGSGPGSFNYPDSAVVDAEGNIYVVDTWNHRIQKFDFEGDYLTQWGGYGTGIGQFSEPHGIAIDNSNNVYVTDTRNLRVQKFSSAGVFTAAYGSPGTGDGQFTDPGSIAVNSLGDMYVGEWALNRVQKLSETGSYLQKWDQYGSGNGEFIGVASVAVDSFDNFYVADRLNNRIQKFDVTGNFVIAWGGGDGALDSLHLVTDAQGNIYIADPNNQRVQKFDSDGNFIKMWGWGVNNSVPGTNFEICTASDICQPGVLGSGNGQFSYPFGIAVGDAGQVYVVDTQNHRIQKFIDLSFMLDDDESTTYTIDPGSFTITEQLLVGWAAPGIVCDGGSPAYGSNSVSLTLTPGDNITCTFTNYSPNEPPVAVDDAHTVDEDATLVVDVPGVLGNDTDPDGDLLTAALVDDAVHGELALNSEGSFVYSPETNYFGPDSFTYRANDGMEDSNIATVAITVNPVNDPPTVSWSTPPASPSILNINVPAVAEFSDVDSGDSHICTWDWGDGTVEGPTPCSAGSVTGIHAYVAVGSYTVTFTVTDSGGSAVAITGPVVVQFAFTGFFRPVDNPPVINTIKAGSAVPMKFSIDGDHGLNIIALGYPRSVMITCDDGILSDQIEETVAPGSSTLQYDPLSDRYQYNWKTQKYWSGTCRQFQLLLVDGTMHMANFKFR